MQQVTQECDALKSLLYKSEQKCNALQSECNTLQNKLDRMQHGDVDYNDITQDNNIHSVYTYSYKPLFLAPFFGDRAGV